MLTYLENFQDLFKIADSWYKVHCIASDLYMGAGIAVPMRLKYNLRELIEKTGYNGDWPNCILVNRVFNLITKEKSCDKPSYGSLYASLKMMKKQLIDKKIKHIAMPKIGCGLDRLCWVDVRSMILNVFEDIENITILVCKRKG